MSKRSSGTDGDEASMFRDAKRRVKGRDSSENGVARSDFSVGWICALPLEQTAATAMLDRRYESLPNPPNNPNNYTFGAIGKHHVVIACLPKGRTGTNSAATVVATMVSTFPSIKFGMMVGIGGGVLPKVRLGDVVVSIPTGQFPGVVQWDIGKAKQGGQFERTGTLNNPPTSLLTALSRLETEHEMSGSKIPEYLEELKEKWPRLASKYLKDDSLEDIKFRAGYTHVRQSISSQDVALEENDEEEEDAEDEEDFENCQFCDKTKAVKRKPREMLVHYGLIASGNQVIKDAVRRDQLNKDLGGNVLCVEMEAAGLMNDFPCIVIRGICDYADSHKNDAWHGYAAAVAAAYAKELLSVVPTQEVDQMPAIKSIESRLHEVAEVAHDIRSQQRDVEHQQILDWFTEIDYGSQQSDYFRRRQPGTGHWLLESQEYNDWLSTSGQTLFCPGIPGAGKTIITSVVVDDLMSRFHDNSEISISYIYCNFNRHDDQSFHQLLASLLKQAAAGQTAMPRYLKDLYDKHKKKGTRPSLEDTVGALGSILTTCSRAFIIVDALDECQTSEGCRAKFLSKIFSLQAKHSINFFATSRAVPDVIGCFQSCASLKIRATVADVARYLESQISQLPSFVQQDVDLQKEITRGISEVVDGMFLLAPIYLTLLSDKLTRNDLRSAMNVFRSRGNVSGDAERSKVLAHTYEQALGRISKQMPGLKNLAMNVLSWITCATRQLTTLELQHALAIKINRPELDYGDIPHTGDMISVCAGLVTVDEKSGIIRLVHYTLQEYLKATQEQWFPYAESSITTACISYLSFAVFETGAAETLNKRIQRLESNPFYVYAARNWGHHARKDTESSPNVIRFLHLESLKKLEAATQVLMYPLQNRIKITGLHLAGYFGLDDAASSLLGLGYCPNHTDNFGRTPLWYAARRGHETVVEILLAAGGNCDAAPPCEFPKIRNSVLLAAVERNHPKIVERLLTAGADVNTSISGRMAIQAAWMAIQAASSKGYTEIVEKLLAAGADVSFNLLDWTALQLAAEKGHAEVVEKLLTAGADASARFCGQATLLPASDNSHVGNTQAVGESRSWPEC